ncbi:MAG: alpha/beta hydrolase [Rickettsiaceae bacterium]
MNKSIKISKPPSYDRELALHIDYIIRKLPSPLTLDLIPVSRKLSADSMISNEKLSNGGVFDIRELKIESYDKKFMLNILICLPTEAKGPYPVMYHIHGGGMVSGSYRSLELVCDLYRARKVQMAVVSVDYRLAPENQYPIPLEDCYYGLKWVESNASKYNLLNDKIILSGNSAGGGLAAALSLLARDRKGPKILAQMLQCPMLNDMCNTYSAKQHMLTGVWNTVSNKTGWDALLGKNRGSKDISYYAAPCRAKELYNLPNTFIDVGSVESLRDEAIEFANKIWQSGGNAELHVWGGAFHSFDQWVPSAIVSKTANKARIEWLKRMLS